jgi:selenocysteine lyase/cysteine desulfurase
LKQIKDIKLYGDLNLDTRLGIIPFNIKGMTDEMVATILSCESGIAVRNGCFCAHPYVKKLLNISNKVMIRRIKNPNQPHPGLVRASFGLYNTCEEVDIFIKMINQILVNKKSFLKKYRNILS